MQIKMHTSRYLFKITQNLQKQLPFSTKILNLLPLNDIDTQYIKKNKRPMGHNAQLRKLLENR